MFTRFRGFQLADEGSLFSFYTNGHYTLIEARIPKAGIEVLAADLTRHNAQHIDVLHITSWDLDHCNSTDLMQIINQFRPAIIEVPDYEPETDDGRLCKRIIFKYDVIHQAYRHNVRVMSLDYMRTLPAARPRGTEYVVYPSEFQCNNKNDKSLIKLFRSENFSVLSLGDCESCDLGKRLSNDELIRTEVDVLILPHHGADNGFITGELLDVIRPKVAICSSNMGNMYDHPRQAIRNLLNERGIPLLTTKRGDVVVWHDNGLQSNAVSFNGDNAAVESGFSFTPKRYTA
jgi:competence protein ComEC